MRRQQPGERLLQPQRPPGQLDVPALQAVAGFFGDSLDAVRVAIAALPDLATEVRRPDYPQRRPDGSWLWPRDGLFAEGWAFIACAPHTHPLSGEPISRIPVPPRRDRPFVEGLAPTMVDPWIGPTNEIWRALVGAARRELRLIELDAPPMILENEAARVQHLLETAWRATREPPPLPSAVSTLIQGPLVPPLPRALADLDEWSAAEMHGVAALASGGFVIQEPSRVRVTGADGRVLHELPPAGCKLAGTHGDLAIFQGFFSATHPALADGVWSEPVHGEVSVVDARAGRYVANAPTGLPARFLEHGEPEELLLGGERIDIGGDRPGVFAYATGLAHAWIGEDDDTRIIELATAIPHVVPTRPAGAVRTVDLGTREGDDDERDPDEPGDDELDSDEPGDDDGGFDEPSDAERGFDEPGGCAIVFANGRWLLLWPDGTVADHRRAPIVRLSPPPRAAAFSADGGSIACLLGDGRLVVLAL